MCQDSHDEVWSVRTILSAVTWPPTRSTLCEWCPFYEQGCSLDPAMETGDDMADWLDGVA